jgi:nitrogen fixation/metabolism regulation signal transduction histidine kinase
MKSFRPPSQNAVFQQRKIFRFSLFFKWKYTVYLLSAVVGSTLLVAGPIYFFLAQNFKIFLELSYEHAPQLLEHLEREQSWLIIFFSASLISLTLFCLYFGLHITQRMVRPLDIFDRRLKVLGRGDFAAPKLNIRENDDFHELLQSINALEAHLKKQTHRDLERLSEIWKKTTDTEARREIEAMVREKQKQIGLESADDFETRRFIENFSSVAATHDSRHAS